MDFFSMNQLAASPENMFSVFWLAMIRIKNNTSAGAIRFRAVPPIVWSAFRLMAAKASNRLKMAQDREAKSMARKQKPCIER